MFLSRSCEIAIQAVLYIAKHQDLAFIPIKQIARDTELSFHFLGKILQTLSKKGILKSYKGPRGGVSLVKSPDSIALVEIVEAIDGLDFYNRCLIGLPECDGDKPCAVHHQWGAIREEIFQMFSKTTIQHLIHEK